MKYLKKFDESFTINVFKMNFNEAMRIWNPYPDKLTPFTDDDMEVVIYIKEETKTYFNGDKHRKNYTDSEIQQMGEFTIRNPKLEGNFIPIIEIKKFEGFFIRKQSYMVTYYGGGSYQEGNRQFFKYETDKMSNVLNNWNIESISG